MDEQTALPFLRQNAPDKPDGVLRAAYLRAGGFLGQALALLQGEDEFPAVQQLAAAYAARDRMDMLRVLLLRVLPLLIVAAVMEAYVTPLVLALLAALYALTQHWLSTRGVRRFESIR